MFAGTLTRNVETAAAQYTGMIHSTRFDIAIQLETRPKMSARSPDFDVTAVNKSGRKVRIGTAWNETGNTSGNPYISMQIDVGLGPFRVNAVQTKEARAAQSGAFEIILVRNRARRSIADTRMHRAMRMRRCLDGGLGLQIVGNDQRGDRTFGQGDTHATVDQMADLAGCGCHVHIFIGHVLVQRDQIDFLLIVAAQ